MSAGLGVGDGDGASPGAPRSSDFRAAPVKTSAKLLRRRDLQPLAGSTPAGRFRARVFSRLSPSTSSMAMYGVFSWTPVAWTVTMFWCRSFPAILASLWKRVTERASRSRPGGSIFRATLRSMDFSIAS
jgi:hypothetical protein